MQVPMEVTFRHMDKSPALETLIREQAHKLERYCDHINSCQVVVERDHASQNPSNTHEFRVRVDLTVAGGHEVVSYDTAPKATLSTVIREVFHRAGRQLKRLSSEQRHDVKRHPAQSMQAVITKLFSDYGFISTADGREIYFHARSVVTGRFEDLKIGMGVAYNEEAGDEGPQASSLRVVDSRHGHRELDEESRI